MKLRAWIRRLAGVYMIRRREARVVEEIETHLALLAADMRRRGMSREEARVAAVREMGDVARVRETIRELPTPIPWDSIGRELAHAARRLWKAPAFFAVAMLTFAIGVGVNTAMLGLIDSLLLRPPAHVDDPDHVVRIGFVDAPKGMHDYPTFEALGATAVFDGIAGYYERSVSIGRGVDAHEGRALFVTQNFFHVLGVRPATGRLFGSSPTEVASENGIVLSYGYWQRRFGGDPRIVGAHLVVGASTYDVVGVAPSGFAVLQDRPVDVWLPLNDAAAGYLFDGWRTQDGSIWLDFVGRVPGTATRQVIAERAGELLQHDAVQAPTRIELSPLLASRSDTKPLEARVSLWLGGVTALVLLIACANLTNLMVTRNITRNREYAVRSALGATVGRLRQQALADVCAIAIPGAVVAVFVDYAVRAALPLFLTADVPLARGLLDGRGLALLSLSVLVAISFVSIVTLLQLRPVGLSLSLVSRTGDDRRGRAWTGHALLALQSGLCVALVFMAGLFAKSLDRVLSLDLGVDMERTVQISLNIPRGSRPLAEQQALYELALERVQEHPAVEHAALSVAEPFRSGMGSGPFTPEQSRSELWPVGSEVAYRSAVGAGFFRAVGASLEGRDFTDADASGAPPVVILSNNLAARLFPSGNALDNCVFLDEPGICYRVVGVIGGVWKLSALDRDKMAVYTPLLQTPGPVTFAGALLVRSRGSAGPMIAQLRSIVQDLDPNLPAASLSRMTDLLAWEIRPWRLGAILFASFSAVALLVAAVGVYGAVAFTTALRTREIGVRVALGAGTTHVVRIAAGAGFGAVAVGIVVGSAVTLMATRGMGDVLYQTSPTDPVVLAQTAGLLVAVAASAVFAPVVRALRFDPATMLRSE
jgi:predicted permease